MATLTSLFGKREREKQKKREREAQRSTSGWLEKQRKRQVWISNEIENSHFFWKEVQIRFDGLLPLKKKRIQGRTCGLCATT